VDAVLAAREADGAGEGLEGALEATPHTVVALHGEEHGLLRVQVTEVAGTADMIEATKVGDNVLAEEGVIREVRAITLSCREETRERKEKTGGGGVGVREESGWRQAKG